MAKYAGDKSATMLASMLAVAAVLPGVATAQDPSASATPPGAGAPATPSPAAVTVALPVRPSDDALDAAAATLVSDVPIPFPADVDLDAVAAEADAQANALRTAHWSLRALADSFEGDPTRAFAFVRDSIGFDAYPGVLRGAQGTLAARAGNAWDRAILLKTLLDTMSLTTRYATAELDPATARRVSGRVLDPVRVPLEDGRSVAADHVRLDAVGRRATRDYALLREALGDRAATMRALVPEDLVQDTRAHAWVQVRWGTEWLDLDPTMTDSEPGAPLAPATSTTTEVPADLIDQVTLRVITSHLSGDSVQERAVLEQTFDAPDVADQQVFLYFQPQLEGIGGGIVRVLTGVEGWTPVLLVDGTATAGSAFEAGSRGTDIFGDPTTTSPLVSLRIEVTRHVPGRPDETATHVLLDRVPPEMADAASIADTDLAPLPSDDAGPLVMGVLTQLVVSTGGASGWMQAVRRSIAADFASLLLSEDDTAGEHALGDLLYPLAVANGTLTLASEQLAVPAIAVPGRVRGYVDAPRVWLMTSGQDPLVATDMATGIDLLIDDVRVVGADDAAAAEGALGAMWYGTVESALETELGLARAGGLGDPPGELTSTSLAMDAALSVLDGPSEALGGATPLVADLASGSLAVVPGDVAGARAWWVVDPRSGATRAVLDPGVGGDTGTGGVNGKIAWGTIRHRPPVVHRGGAGGANTHWLHPDGSIQRYPPGAQPPGGGAPQGPPPSRCGGGQEYVTILGCVSIPAAWAIRVGLGLIVTTVVLDAIVTFAM